MRCSVSAPDSGRDRNRRRQFALFEPAHLRVSRLLFNGLYHAVTNAAGAATAR